MLNRTIFTRMTALALALTSFFICTGISKESLPVNYGFEAVLAQPEKVAGIVIDLHGYAKIQGNAFILYYSLEDCLYDTRENAIFVREREGYDIIDYVKERYDYAGYLQLGYFFDLFLVSIQVETPRDGYAAYAEHIGYNRPLDGYIFEQARTTPYKTGVLDQEQPVYVSVYRLLGDPWAYDGKMVKIDFSYFDSAVLFLYMGRLYNRLHYYPQDIITEYFTDLMNLVTPRMQEILQTKVPFGKIFYAKSISNYLATGRFYKENPAKVTYGFNCLSNFYIEILYFDFHERDIPKIREELKKYE